MDVPLPLPLLLDGATGTELQKRGMPKGACTESWALQHPEALLEVQRAYIRAGSQVLLAPTFGANRASLGRFGLENRVEDYNRRLVALTRQAADGRALVAANLAPTGLSIPPWGDTPFDTLVEVYAQQAAACREAGADLFVAETMVNMAQARAAVLGVRSVSRRPVWVTFTCDREGRTPGGSDVLAAMIIMQGMGVSAFGLNCCDADIALEQLARLAPYATVPLIAKPNAGLPGPEGDYPCSPADFTALAPALAGAGASTFGGCCGAGPEHISALAGALKGTDLAAGRLGCHDPDVIPCASETEARFITPDVDVGETIECTPDLMEDILRAEEESPQGALKISILEQDDVDMLAENQYAIKDALCLYSDVPELLESALRVYQGRAFWDGTGDLDKEFLDRMTREYGLVQL
ncbi:MAG: homocysteine S-methyltransferase family protein [Oscillospiraceae bacterium]|nr:homocysteine S-methyltransferase family protein [Oscillospiraceae bacterium]